MNLLISNLPEFPFLHSKQPKFHNYIELMIKEITQYFCRLVQFSGKVFTFSGEKDPRNAKLQP